MAIKAPVPIFGTPYQFVELDGGEIQIINTRPNSGAATVVLSNRGFRMLGSVVNLPQTGGTNNVAVKKASIDIPIGAVGPNSVLTIQGLLSANNNANVKAVYFVIDGTTVYSVPVAGVASYKFHSMIVMKGSLTAQALGPLSGAQSGVTLGGSAQANVAGAIDFSKFQTLEIWVQNALASDTTTIESIQLYAVG